MNHRQKNGFKNANTLEDLNGPGSLEYLLIQCELQVRTYMVIGNWVGTVYHIRADRYHQRRLNINLVGCLIGTHVRPIALDSIFAFKVRYCMNNTVISNINSR